MVSAAELTSPRSPRVVAARRLGRRGFRGKERRFLAEGPQAVREAVAHRTPEGPTLLELFATAEAAERHSGLLERARAAGCAVHRASDEVVAGLSQTVTPQGLVGVCRFLDRPLADILAGRPEVDLAALPTAPDVGEAAAQVDAVLADHRRLTEGTA